MPRRGAIALAITGLALVLLLSFKTPDDPALATGGSDASVGTSTPTPSATDSTTGTDPDGTAATPTPTGGQVAEGVYSDGTVDGSVVSTRFGSMQVEVVISEGVIVDVVALQLPSRDLRSLEISETAASILRSAVLEAQSADVDLVSGATYSSRAYLQSLQSALDQAQA